MRRSSRWQGMKFYDPVILHDQLLDDELSPLRRTSPTFAKVPAKKSDFDL